MEYVYHLNIILEEDCDLRKGPKLIENITTSNEAINQLNTRFQTLMKGKLSNYFKSCKTSLRENPQRMLMQVDFAENHELVEQDKIQSAHCNHNQAT